MGLEDSLDGLEDGQITKRCAMEVDQRGVCATLVTRWIKYRIIEKDFWESSENERHVNWIKRDGNVGVKPGPEWGEKLVRQQDRYRKLQKKAKEPVSSAHRAVERLTGQNDYWAKGIWSSKREKIKAAGIKQISLEDSELEGLMGDAFITKILNNMAGN